MHSTISLSIFKSRPSLKIFVPRLFFDSNKQRLERISLERPDIGETSAHFFSSSTDDNEETELIYLESLSRFTSKSRPQGFPQHIFDSRNCWLWKNGLERSCPLTVNEKKLFGFNASILSKTKKTSLQIISYEMEVRTYLEDILPFYTYCLEHFPNAIFVPQRVFSQGLSLDGPIFAFWNGMPLCYVPVTLDIHMDIGNPCSPITGRANFDLKSLLTAPYNLVNFARQNLTLSVKISTSKFFLIEKNSLKSLLILVLFSSLPAAPSILLSRALPPQDQKYFKKICTSLGLSVSLLDFASDSLEQFSVEINLWLGPDSWLPLIADFFIENYSSIKVTEALKNLRKI